MALGDGTGWDETDPADGDDIKDGAKEIRDLRVGTSLRSGKEHTVPDVDTAGGEHTAGSAIGFYKAAVPTVRPDGGAAGYTPPSLDSDDAGRLWLDTDDDVLYVWNGSSWDKVQIVQDSITDDVVNFEKMDISSLKGSGSTEVGIPLYAYGSYTGDGAGTQTIQVFASSGFRIKQLTIFDTTAAVEVVWMAFTDETEQWGWWADNTPTLGGVGSIIAKVAIGQHQFEAKSGSTNINGNTYRFVAIGEWIGIQS